MRIPRKPKLQYPHKEKGNVSLVVLKVLNNNLRKCIII